MKWVTIGSATLTLGFLQGQLPAVDRKEGRLTVATRFAFWRDVCERSRQRI